MKKEKIIDIAIGGIYCLPVPCFFVAVYSIESKLGEICAYYILLLGWVSPAIHMKQKMPDIEHPAGMAAIIHFATVILGEAMFDWTDSSDPIGKMVWALIVVFSFAALGYHSKRHEEYKYKYEQALEENKKLREEIKNGHNT